ncbi:MAG: hypothetical protein ABJC79_16875 [Acidimicrobiia bacterium]
MTSEFEPEAEHLPLANERELAIVRPPEWPRYVIGVGTVAYGIMIIAAVGTGTFELVEAVPLIALLAWLSHRIAHKIAEIDRDPAMVQFVFAAFWAKMIGTMVRALVVSELYGNRSDALDYHKWGQSLAPQFRALDFSGVPSYSGTYFMRVVTGVIYALTGSSQMSGAAVLSFLSFIGLLLLWRAFKLAVPNGATYRYGLLMLFLPSFLYWPSALGKEGWAIFCLGIASYGVARAMHGAIPLGVLCFFSGLAGVAWMRPHVALIMFCGVALAAAVGRSQRPGVKASSLRLVLFGSLMILGVALASSTASFFGVARLDQETINATFASAEGRTSEAGSSFTPVTMSNPANAPLAIATVLFRPFPFEASSPVAAASAFEGLFLLVLAVKSHRRLRSLGRCMRRQPYVAYCLGITVTFIFAFSAFSNFGILARERCQVLPFFLAMLCLPEWEREDKISIEAALAGRDSPAPSVDDDSPADPYETSEPSADGNVAPAAPPDPYGTDRDPYERFRESHRGNA